MQITLIIGAAFICACAAQKQYGPPTTPVPILKQINKHNEDGSYSYGYEGADGSFKIESKYPNGEVYGKYGYVDDNGQLREVEYGATRRGFEPAGNDINVPPPTLPSQNQQNQYVAPLGPNEEDDGQYREDPSVYYKDAAKYNGAPVSGYQSPAPVSRYQPAPAPVSRYQPAQPAYQEPAYQEPAYEAPQQYYRPQQNYNRDTFLNSDFFRAFNNPTRYTQPAPRYQPPQQYNNPAPRYNPAPANYNNGFNNFGGHPAQNLDINTGSYSVNY